MDSTVQLHWPLDRINWGSSWLISVAQRAGLHSQLGFGAGARRAYKRAEASTPELPLSANKPARSNGAGPHRPSGGCP